MVVSFIGILTTIVFVIAFVSLIIWIGCMIFRVDSKITRRIEDVVCVSFLTMMVLVVIFNILITP